MRRHNVRISVDNEGNFTIDPSALGVREHDTITFVSTSGNFRVMFKDKAEAFDKIEAFGTPEDGDKESSEGGNTIEVVEGILGQYHYAVAVAAGDRVFMDAGCPVIIVKGG